MNVSAFRVATGHLERTLSVIAAERTRFDASAPLNFTIDHAAAQVASGVVGFLLASAAQDACSPPKLHREEECSWVVRRFA